MRGWAGLLSLPLAALLAVGLSFRAAFQEPAEFTFVNGAEPTTLDPGLMTGEPEGRIADALFEGLMFRDPASLLPVPGAAERFEVSDQGRRYVFHLRPGARWTDGTPVTAGDFAYAWRRLQLPEHGGEYAYILHGVRQARALNLYEAQAASLAGEVRETVAELPPGPVTAEAWTRLVVAHDLVGSVRGTSDRALEAAVHSARGLTGEQRAALPGALAREATRRARLARHARAHFGIDEGVYAVDDHTLVVELVAPIPYFLELTAFYPSFPVPRHVVEVPGNEADWFLPDKIVSNGPFELEAWRVGDRIRLRRSESYWGSEHIALHSVDVLPIENTTTALNLYLTGDVQWLPRYPAELVDALRQRRDHYSHPAFSVYYYRINTRRPPLDDRRVRLALALAVDRQTLVEEVLRLGELPARHLVPPGVPGYEPPPTRIGFDPDRARALLAEAGFPGGRGFPEIGILYNTLESHKKIAELLADQLGRELGIRVKPYNQEWQSYLATMRVGDFDLARAGWIGDYLDPNTFLDIWVTNGGNNQTGWSHPTYDRLIAAAADVEAYLREPFEEGLGEPERVRVLRARIRAARGEDERRGLVARLRLDLLREAERILVDEEIPILPLYFYVASGLVSPRVEGFHTWIQRPDGTRLPNLQGLHPLRGLRMRPAP